MKKKIRSLAFFGLLMLSLVLLSAIMMVSGLVGSPLAAIIPIGIMLFVLGSGKGLMVLGQAGFAALSADRDTPRRSGQQISLGVATGKKIFAGALVLKSATGFATPGAAAVLGTASGIGRASEMVDNTLGADGDVAILIDIDVFRFANSAAGEAITVADIGNPCYVVDDQTVARTSNTGARAMAGIVYDVDSSGVWVDFTYGYPVCPAPRAVVALADAAATLTAAQMINSGIFTQTPGAGRALTVDTAALIVAGFPRAKVGDTFEFTVVCLAAFAATITTAAGITLVGNMAVNNQSAVFLGRFTNVGSGTEAVTIYRKA
jgi:hypothetical protein